MRGHLGATVAQSFVGFEATVDAGDTVLRGSISDQDRLHQILEQIDGFGLELLEVRRVKPPPRAVRQ